MRVPVNASEITSNYTLPLQVANGSLWISELCFSPTAVYPQPIETPDRPGSTSRVCFTSPSVGYFNYSVFNSEAGVATVNGSVDFRSPAYYQGLGAIDFNETLNRNETIAVKFETSPGLILNLNGMLLGGSGSAGWTQYCRGASIRKHKRCLLPFHHLVILICDFP